MTQASKPRPQLDAVDALAQLRHTLQELRQREQELCDEICSYGTNENCDDMEGSHHRALIETRQVRRLNIEALPPEVLSDPRYFERHQELHVLLWPKAPVQEADVLPESPQEAVPAASITAEVSETTATSQTQTQMSDAPLVAEPADAPAPAPTVAEQGDVEQAGETAPETPPEATSTDMSPSEDEIAAQIVAQAKFADLHEGTKAAARAEPEPAPPEPATPEIDAEAPFGDLPQTQGPALDVSVPAQLPVDTVETPKDLRATAEADLQPLAGLEDEHVAQFEASDAENIDLVTQTEDIEDTFDREAEADEAHAQALSAQFSTNRTAS